MKNKIDNKDILKQALRCTGFANEKNQKGNKALATIGDSLLSFVFLDIIRDLGMEEDGETYTDLKIILQANIILNTISKKLLENKPIESANNDLSGEKGYATVMEAYLYALYKNEGLKSVKTYIYDEILPVLRSEEIQSIVRRDLNLSDTTKRENALKSYENFLMLEL